MDADPRAARAAHLPGLVLARRGRRTEALAWVRWSIDLDPSVLDFHNNYGAAVSKPDDVTQRLKEYGHSWRDVYGVHDPQISRMLAEDRIDVLVDLAGHTGGHRLTLLARRPVPVQATYLGYPGSTGMSAVDWRITDALSDPPGQMGGAGAGRPAG